MLFHFWAEAEKKAEGFKMFGQDQICDKIHKNPEHPGIHQDINN